MLQMRLNTSATEKLPKNIVQNTKHANPFILHARDHHRQNGDPQRMRKKDVVCQADMVVLDFLSKPEGMDKTAPSRVGRQGGHGTAPQHECMRIRFQQAQKTPPPIKHNVIEYA